MPGNFFQFLVHSLLLLSLGLSVRRPAQRDKSLQKLVQVQHFSWPTIIHNRHMPCVTAQYHAHDHVPNIMRTTTCPMLCAQPCAQYYPHDHVPSSMCTATCPILSTRPLAQYYAHNHMPNIMCTTTCPISCAQPHAQYYAHNHVPNIMRTTMCPILCARPRAQCYVHSHMPNVKRTTTCPMLCAQPRAQYHAHNRAFCRLGDKALRQLVTSQPALLSYTPTTLASNLTAMGECLVRECLCALNGEW